MAARAVAFATNLLIEVKWSNKWPHFNHKAGGKCKRPNGWDKAICTMLIPLMEYKVELDLEQ